MLYILVSVALFCRTASGSVSLLVVLPMRCSGLMLWCP